MPTGILVIFKSQPYRTGSLLSISYPTLQPTMPNRFSHSNIHHTPSRQSRYESDSDDEWVRIPLFRSIFSNRHMPSRAGLSRANTGREPSRRGSINQALPSQYNRVSSHYIEAPSQHRRTNSHYSQAPSHHSRPPSLQAPSQSSRTSGHRSGASSHYSDTPSQHSRAPSRVLSNVSTITNATIRPEDSASVAGSPPRHSQSREHRSHSIISRSRSTREQPTGPSRVNYQSRSQGQERDYHTSSRPRRSSHSVAHSHSRSNVHPVSMHYTDEDYASDSTLRADQIGLRRYRPQR